MDWQDPKSPDRVVIAVARLPAKNLSDYRGSVFFNPGVCSLMPTASRMTIDKLKTRRALEGLGSGHYEITVT